MTIDQEKKILFVDDQADVWIGRFNRYLARYGLRFEQELEAERALERIAEKKPDAVLLDILFPGQNGRMEPKGRAALAAIRERYPELPVVMITSTLSDAAYGIDEEDFAGACYLFSKDRFREATDDDPYAELAQQLLGAIEASSDRRSLDERLGFIVGATERMQAVAETVIQVASSDSTVLLGGETGTGKELVARAIHRLSRRSSGPFVAVNCGGLTDEVLESQLFGHERGAFTGATTTHKGFFEQAAHGTLFLDEVDAMSARLQDKLLRVLQEQRIRRMGAEDEFQVDVRVITATNKSLPDLVAKGLLRQDLYYRLRVVELILPPLRERLADLPDLYTYLVDRLNRKLGKKISNQLRSDVLDKLRGYTWPGNIRELEHALEHAMVKAKANVLTPSALKLDGEAGPAASSLPTTDFVSQLLDGHAGWRDLRLLHGEFRTRALKELVDRLTDNEGRPPSSAQLAQLVGTSDVNMRRILSTAGVRLRRSTTGER